MEAKQTSKQAGLPPLSSSALFGLVACLALAGCKHPAPAPEVSTRWAHYFYMKPFSEINGTWAVIKADTNQIRIGLRSDGVLVWEPFTTTNK